MSLRCVTVLYITWWWFLGSISISDNIWKYSPLFCRGPGFGHCERGESILGVKDEPILCCCYYYCHYHYHYHNHYHYYCYYYCRYCYCYHHHYYRRIVFFVTGNSNSNSNSNSKSKSKSKRCHVTRPGCNESQIAHRPVRPDVVVYRIITNIHLDLVLDLHCDPSTTFTAPVHNCRSCGITTVLPPASKPRHFPSSSVGIAAEDHQIVPHHRFGPTATKGRS